MDKQKIAHRFSQAIETYEKEAVEQRHIAGQLCSMLKFQLEAKGIKPKRIAEIGCGTGVLSRLIKEAFNPEYLWLNDLCEEVQPRFKGWNNTIFVAGDAEKLLDKDFPNNCDLIATSSVIQWFEEPLRFLVKCQEKLSPDGIMAVSSFGPKTFEEIKTLTGRGLAYPPLEQLRNTLSSHYNILIASQQEIKQTFSSPMEVLKHLKNTGVTGMSGNFTWTQKKLHDFCKDYIQKYSIGATKVTLTYQPVYLILQKKD